MTRENTGYFFALEGIDGSGKSTQVKRLAERFRQEGISCYETMEPTDSPIGSVVRNIMTGRIKADSRVIAALFVADRLDHLLNDINGIAAKVEAGVTVLMDRYVFSSYAYQGVDMPMDWVMRANEPCTKILRPTASVFIDVDPELAMERIQKNRAQRELFEELSRLQSVRENYLRAFDMQKNEENVVFVNGNQPPEAVTAEIWDKIVQNFGRESK